MRRHAARRAFTLVELLVVIAIIGILTRCCCLSLRARTSQIGLALPESSLATSHRLDPHANPLQSDFAVNISTNNLAAREQNRAAMPAAVLRSFWPARNARMVAGAELGQQRQLCRRRRPLRPQHGSEVQRIYGWLEQHGRVFRDSAGSIRRDGHNRRCSRGASRRLSCGDESAVRHLGRQFDRRQDCGSRMR